MNPASWLRAAGLLALAVLFACESDAPTAEKPPAVDAAAVRAEAEKIRGAAQDDLDKMKSTASEAAPVLGGADAGQKSGVKE